MIKEVTETVWQAAEVSAVGLAGLGASMAVLGTGHQAQHLLDASLASAVTAVAANMVDICTARTWQDTREAAGRLASSSSCVVIVGAVCYVNSLLMQVENRRG